MWPIILYSLIIFAFINSWELLTAGFVLVYSFWYNAVTLIPLAIVIDGYFGNFETIPTLSLLSVMWYVVVEYLRPKVSNFRGV